MTNVKELLKTEIENDEKELSKRIGDIKEIMSKLMLIENPYDFWVDIDELKKHLNSYEWVFNQYATKKTLNSKIR